MTLMVGTGGAPDAARHGTHRSKSAQSPAQQAEDHGTVCSIDPNREPTMRTGPLQRTGLVLTVVAALAAAPAKGAERYYALIFGSQSSPKRLRDTHTWATFVRVVGEG